MSVSLRNNLTGDRAKLIPAYSDVVIYAEGIPNNILANSFNVKYICKVFIENELVATLKAPPNSNINNKALFRIQSILQDFTETDTNGYYPSDGTNTSKFQGFSFAFNAHSIHQIDKLSRNANNLKGCFCLGAYEHSTTVNGSIIEVASLFSDVVFNFWNAVIQIKDGWNSYDFSTYFFGTVSAKFLSLFPATINESDAQKIQLNQFHTLAFFHGKILGQEESTNIEVAKLRIMTFDASESLVDTIEIENTNDNGGSSASATTTGRGLLYFGCGTAQLAQNGADLTNVTTYFVSARDSSNAQISAQYRFNIQKEDCKGFETIRLAFLNSLGAYDYYNFTKKSTRTTELVKSPIKKNYGTELTHFATENTLDNFNAQIYTQGTQSGGTRNYNTSAIETIEANTDFITQEEAAILKELFTSASVFMQEGTTFVPVVINETEYTLQTTANDKVIQYIIQIEKGHNTRVQRL